MEVYINVIFVETVEKSILASDMGLTECKHNPGRLFQSISSISPSYHNPQHTRLLDVQVPGSPAYLFWWSIGFPPPFHQQNSWLDPNKCMYSSPSSSCGSWLMFTGIPTQSWQHPKSGFFSTQDLSFFAGKSSYWAFHSDEYHIASPYPPKHSFHFFVST